MPLRERDAVTASAVHCSLGERAFTDVITNATQFTGFVLENDIRRLLVGGGLPKESLFSVLHESVHHWCFTNPVMTTVALLHTRARMRALEYLETKDTDIVAHAFDDRFRYEAVTLALRPLAEGLAQFFEYDVIPDPRTPIASQPMNWAIFFYTNVMESDPWIELVQVLYEARRKENAIRRKTNLLLQPLTMNAGGYLPGYLSVKSLWRACRERNPAFHDADLFAVLLRRYFYGDYGFVRIILDSNLSRSEWLARLVEYFSSRFDGLFQLDLQKAEAVLLETGHDIPEPAIGDGWVKYTDYPPMGTDPTNVREGGQLLKELRYSLDGIYVPEEFADEPDACRTVQLLPLAYRGLIWLGEMPVQLRVVESKVAVLHCGDILFRADSALGDGDVPDSGKLNLYISMNDNFVGAVVSAGSSTIATFNAGGNEEAANRLNDLPGDRASIERFQGILSDAYSAIADEFSIGRVHDELLQHLRDFLEDFFGNGAVLYAPAASRSSVVMLMRENGLLAAVDNDVSLLKSAAALSLAASLRLCPDEVATHIPTFVGPVENVLAELDRHSIEKNFPIVIGDDGVVLQSFV